MAAKCSSSCFFVVLLTFPTYSCSFLTFLFELKMNRFLVKLVFSLVKCELSIKYGFLRFTDHSVFIYILHSVLVFLEVGMYFLRWLEIFHYCWRRARPNKTLQSWYLQDTSRRCRVFCLARWKMLRKDRRELQEQEPYMQRP